MHNWFDLLNSPPIPTTAPDEFIYSSLLSYLVFMPKLSTHRMHDSGSIVPHIWTKVFTDIQMSRIMYNHYINNVSRDYDDYQRNGTVEDSITPQE
jgi:hypothetical protein